MSDQRQYDVFLSYNQDDQKEVELIERRLREEAKLRPFLDKWHLVPGDPWQEAIERALANSETIAVFVGPSGISAWHNAEMRDGLDRAVRNHDDVRVIPVLLPGAEQEKLPRFLSRHSWVDFRTGLDDADAFARLVAGVRGEPPEQADAFDLPDEPAPYPSLLPFTAQQSQFFFGRDKERVGLLRRVRESAFVAVVGASGSGKSSLVLAGLLPSIEKSWQALTLVPGARPLRALADQLATFFAPKDRLLVADRLEQRFRGRSDGLSTAISNILAARPNNFTLLFVVDQFEEVFTQTLGTSDEAQRQQQAFIDNLVDTVQASGGRVRVVITLRADFIQPCLEFPGLRSLLEPNQLFLGPLMDDALREAIVKPAQAVGALFQKGLVRSLVSDIRGRPAALPLLQFALAQLWQRRRGIWLTHEAYEDIDGVKGAINRLADAVYDRLSPTQQRLARNLFVRLVAFGAGTGNTRRRVRREELRLVGGDETEVKRLVGLFSHRDVRLIATDKDTVELAHEAVIEEWKHLRDWLEEDDAARFTHRRLTDAAEQWQSHPQDKSYLYRGTPLSEAIQWAATHGEEMNIEERAFLDSSQAESELAAREDEARRQRELENERKLAAEANARAAADRKLAQESQARAAADRKLAAEAEARTEEAKARAAAERRNASRLRVFLAVGAVLLVAAISSAGIAVRNQGIADSSAATAEVSAHQEATARANAVHSEATARSAAEEAAKARDDAQREARISNAQARATEALLKVASGEYDRAVLLARAAVLTDTLTPPPQSLQISRALQSAHEFNPLSQHGLFTGTLAEANWSPTDSRYVITRGRDGSATLWDMTPCEPAACRPQETLKWGEGEVVDVVWSPDSQQVLTVGNDKIARIWNITTGKSTQTLDIGLDTMIELRWGKDGPKLLSRTQDNITRIWDVATGQPARTLALRLDSSRMDTRVEAWSPDWRHVVLVSADDGSFMLWDAERNELERKLEETLSATLTAEAVVWSPDGYQVLIRRTETVRIWNAATGDLVRTLEDVKVGGDNKIFAATWSPDGRQVLINGGATVHIWDVEAGYEVRTLEAQDAFFEVVVMSPDGRQVLTGGNSPGARIWIIDNRLLAAALTRTICDTFAAEEDEVYRVVPGWSGCKTELEEVADELREYDMLQGGSLSRRP
jgi:hypothetical protein